MSKWTTFAFSWHRISVFRVGKMCFLDKKELSKLIEMSFLSRNTSFPLWKKKCVNEHQVLFLSMLLHFLFLPSALYLHSAYTGSPFFQSGKDVFLARSNYQYACIVNSFSSTSTSFPLWKTDMCEWTSCSVLRRLLEVAAFICLTQCG
jgi:hypothetical protein